MQLFPDTLIIINHICGHLSRKSSTNVVTTWSQTSQPPGPFVHHEGNKHCSQLLRPRSLLAMRQLLAFWRECQALGLCKKQKEKTQAFSSALLLTWDLLTSQMGPGHPFTGFKMWNFLWECNELKNSTPCCSDHQSPRLSYSNHRHLSL